MWSSGAMMCSLHAFIKFSVDPGAYIFSVKEYATRENMVHICGRDPKKSVSQWEPVALAKPVHLPHIHITSPTQLLSYHQNGHRNLFKNVTSYVINFKASLP
jgi:hypothetical protein